MRPISSILPWLAAAGLSFAVAANAASTTAVNTSLDELLGRELQPGMLQTVQNADGSFQLDNRVQSVSARISATVVEFMPTVSAQAGDGFSLQTSAVGRSGNLQTVMPQGLVRDGDVIVRHDSGGLQEIFSNTPGGIRHDVILQDKPAGGGELHLRLQLAGGQVSARGEGVHIQLSSGRDLTYDRLAVMDSAGRHIPARMSVITGGLDIAVDDREARYPLTIDPTVGDPRWLALGSIPGTDGNVTAIHAHGTDVYVGGNFTIAGNTAARGIARWNGSGWSALGSGLAIRKGTLSVSAIAVDNSGNVYVGGQFTSAGGLPALNIAKWDGSNWSALGKGTNKFVSALQLDATGKLYVGGGFSSAGGVAKTSGIALWNGSAWSAVGSGFKGGVSALAMDSTGKLYAGGWMTQSGTSYLSSLASWDGAAWSSVGGGVSGLVSALAIDGSDQLYVGGSFKKAGAVSAANVARWDGSAWNALGAGLDKAATALAMDGTGKLYVAGLFSTAGGAAATGMAMWNGSGWTGLATGTTDTISGVTVDSNNHAFFGGVMTAVDGFVVNHVGEWDGAQWQTLGSGFTKDASGVLVNAVAVDAAGAIYVAGRFSDIGGLTVNNIARWNGVSWQALGGGLAGGALGMVNTLVFDHAGNLYAGGTFAMADSLVVNGVAKWNGTSWSGMGTGGTQETLAGVPVISAVRSMVVDSANNVYAAGDFTMISGVEAHGIAQWTGSSWVAMGTGVASGETIYALAIDDADLLYAAGKFIAINGVSANRIARWNGSQWSALGAGMDNIVYALAIDPANRNLYAGGIFSKANGVKMSRIARWNGYTWLPLGKGMNNTVNALQVDAAGKLYAGGLFTSAGGVPVKGVAQWGGSVWTAMGAGITANTTVQNFAVDTAGHLVVAGNFMTAGTIGAPYVAEWLLDTNGNGTLDVDEADDDGDGVLDVTDNCPRIVNADQTDSDSDGLGDLCDPDDDNDGLADVAENILGTNPLLADTDGDGRADGIDPLPLDSMTWADARGDSAADNLGAAVAYIGDVDGDGYGDVLVGAPKDSASDALGVVHTGAGSARIVSGKDGSTLHTFVGTSLGDAFGAAVAVADVDGDGKPDFIIGAPNADYLGVKDAGAVSIYKGTDDSLIYTLHGKAAGDHFGTAVSGAGDVDDDGKADIIVGAPKASSDTVAHCGSATVYSGISTGGAGEEFTFYGIAPGDLTGTAVSAAGELTADTYADVLVGSPGAAKGTGRVDVVSGATGLSVQSFNGEKTGDAFGAAISGGADLSNDGSKLPDIVIGAPRADVASATLLKDAGRVYVYKGETFGLLGSIDGGAAGDNFGAAVSVTGDLDADGVADIAVGAPRADVTATVNFKLVVLKDAGKMTVYSSAALAAASNPAPLANAVTGAAAGDNLGTSVDGRGDVSHDGLADVAVGAPRADGTAMLKGKVLKVRDSGRVQLVSGAAL